MFGFRIIGMIGNRFPIILSHESRIIDFEPDLRRDPFRFESAVAQLGDAQERRYGGVRIERVCGSAERLRAVGKIRIATRYTNLAGVIHHSA